MSTHNLCFEQKYEKYQNFYLKIFIFLVVKFILYLNRHVFVMFLNSPCKHIVATHWKRLAQTLQDTHNICFSGEIRISSLFICIKKGLIWGSLLTFPTLWANSADEKLIFFLENRI